MKRIKYLLLFVGTALFLAACGGGGGGGGGDQNGTLAIALNGVSSAPVVVSNASGNVVDETVTDGDTFTLAAGSYTVTGGAVEGYTAPGAQNVTVTAGGTTDVTLTYTLVGGGDPDPDTDPDPDADPGIYVSLNPFGVRDANTTVTVTDFDSGDVVATSSGVGSLYYELDAGLYVVTAERAGYGTVAREVEHGDGVTSVSITLVSDADSGNPGGDVEPGSVTFSYIDVNGYPFFSTKENNPEKDVDLLVAQTEDRICVTVSTGVSNAIVDIDITNTLFDSVAIVADNCAEEVELTAASASTRSFQADANGDVQFSLFSTNAWPFFEEIADFIREPIKIVVSARGADGRADISEFKVFFLNMSHLYFGHGETYGAPYDMIEDAIEAWLDNPTVRMDDRVHTGQRWGRDFGSITNIWGATDTNSHFFGTGAAQKQPFDFAPFGVGSGFVHIDFGGRVVYSIVGGDADMVAWVSGNDCVIVSGDCVIDWSDGFNLYAEIAPVAGVDLEDLPIQVEIQATYFHDVTYGPFTYSFPLKQYTVSKQWVGGFLEIDKYVDQHVLTWRGYDSDARVSETLDAYDEPVIVAEGDEFRSTVHVTVTNSSDSPIYNVAVRDGVPAELGVIVDSISNGGTYDISNHTVTWNFNLTPELQEIGVGDSFTFTFDVYARHKPGYCWDGAGDANFTVQPIHPLVQAIGDVPAECDVPYEDPYLVTNGLQANSVTAAGFFSDDITGPQYVFSYSPLADESDIWVVRPLFEISKDLRSQNLVTVGGSAFFDIEVWQLDRVDRDPEYAVVHALYPWEFNNDDTTSGTGHDADSSAARNNPYAYDVNVDDWFDVGIDFTNGTNFSDVTGGVIQIDNILDKNFSWSPIDSLPVGVRAASVVTFSTNLPSFTLIDPAGGYDEGNIERADGANGEVTITIDGEDYDVPAWQNCAYLWSRQLNQPDPELNDGFADTWYAENGVRWDQSEVYYVEDYIYARPAASYPALEDCDAVAVLPVPPTAFVTLTTNGEYDEWAVADPEDADDSTAGDFNLADLRDGYNPNDSFFYVLTAESNGGADGQNVTISGSLSNARVQFTGDAYLYIGEENNWVYNQTGTTTTGSFTFTPVSIPAGQFARVVLSADARTVGVVDLNAELTYSNGPDWQPLPLTVREETSVKP